MPAFAAVLDNGEIAAIISYCENAWGNNSGRTVRLEQVEELRKN